MCEISVIIPVYNKKRYLRETVGSVLDQTAGDLELLLIDDGSTDGSGRLCDVLSASDIRIRVYHTKNRGVGAARNLGIRKASGKYISFIDADDRIEKTFLEKLKDAMEKDRADMAMCGYYEIIDGKRIDRDLKRSGPDNVYYDVLRQNRLCTSWNKLYLREKIHHLFDERTSTCEDSIFCTQYYSDNLPKTAYVYENLYGYIRRKDCLTAKVQERAFYGITKYMSCNMKIAGMISDERTRRAAIQHICKVYFYGVYMFIFQNLCSGPVTGEKLSIIDSVFRDERYRRIMGYIIRYPLYDSKAERASKSEFLYILFSLLGMKRATLFLSRVKKL